jgi:hypothetical protein
MSLIDDINRLHPNAKTSALTVFGQMPFLYIAVYLFAPWLVARVVGNPWVSVHFYFVMSLCFSLSVVWYSLNLISAVLAIRIWEKMFNEQADEGEEFTLSSVYSIGFLSLSILLLYWVKPSAGWYLAAPFGYVISNIFRLVSLTYLEHKDAERKAKTDGNQPR